MRYRPKPQDNEVSGLHLVIKRFYIRGAQTGSYLVEGISKLRKSFPPDYLHLYSRWNRVSQRMPAPGVPHKGFTCGHVLDCARSLSIGRVRSDLQEEPTSRRSIMHYYDKILTPGYTYTLVTEIAQCCSGLVSTIQPT